MSEAITKVGHEATASGSLHPRGLFPPAWPVGGQGRKNPRRAQGDPVRPRQRQCFPVAGDGAAPGSRSCSCLSHWTPCSACRPGTTAKACANEQARSTSSATSLPDVNRATTPLEDSDTPARPRNRRGCRHVTTNAVAVVLAQNSVHVLLSTAGISCGALGISAVGVVVAASGVVLAQQVAAEVARRSRHTLWTGWRSSGCCRTRPDSRPSGAVVAGPPSRGPPQAK